jgi:hypothetical protein
MNSMWKLSWLMLRPEHNFGVNGTHAAPTMPLLQAVITRDIASKLRPQLSGNERESLAKAGIEGCRGISALFEGPLPCQQVYSRRVEEGDQYFRQAIEKDPETLWHTQIGGLLHRSRSNHGLPAPE